MSASALAGWVRCLAAWLLCAVAGPGVQASEAVRIGALAVLEDEDTQRQWQPLVSHLQQALGRAVQLQPLDPVALDQACVDLVYASPDEGKVHLIERMESRHGIHTLEHAEAIGIGSRQYELVDLDK